MKHPLRWKPAVIGGCIGAVMVLCGMYTVNAAKHVYHLSAPSETGVTRPLVPASVDTSWVKSGNPNFRVTVYALTGNTTTGIWACDGPTTFEWTFPHDEQVYILEGSVDIEYMDKKFTLRPGQTALFLAGTKAMWHVPVHLKKSFTIHQPNVVVRLYRKMFGIV